MKLKRWVIVLLLLALAAPAAGAQAAQPDVDLGLSMLKRLYDEQGQFVCSPASLKLALSMAAEGAAGETLGELLGVLGVDAPGALDLSLYAQLQSANAALVSGEIQLLDAYQQRLQDAYQAELFPMEGDVMAQTNAWVDSNTNGMIQNFLTEQPDPSLRLLLLNALALDANWSAKFDSGVTKKDTFNAPGGKRKIPFMHMTRTLAYAEAEGAQAVKLPYEGGQLEMLVILPQRGGLEQALALIEQQGLSWLGEFEQAGEVQLALPKFSMDTELRLKPMLQALGVTSAFEMDADFSGMTGALDLYISDVLQKVRLDVDEDGTRAAAATGVMMEAKGMILEPTKMTVNRPFIALVRGVEDGELLFAAAVTDPKV